MVRPNQIIDSDLDRGEITFLMFARSAKKVQRRVLFLNFPGWFIKSKVSGEDPFNAIAGTELVSMGPINRYAVTVDIDEI
jgi:hypothetical protein